MDILSRLFGRPAKHKPPATATIALPASATTSEPRPLSVDLVLSELSDTDTETRFTAVWRLGGGGHELEEAALRDPRVIEALLAALKDENAKVRQRAAWSLQRHLEEFGRDPRIVEVFSSLLCDQSCSESMLQEVLKGLQLFPSKDNVKPAIDLLASSNDKVRDAAAKLLGKLRDPSAVEPLIAALATAKWPSSLITALGEIGDNRAVDALVDLLHGRFKEDMNTYQTCAAIADALGRIGDPRAIDPIMAALAGAKEAMIGRSGNPMPRMNYINALKALNAVDALKVIRSFKADDHDAVSEAAVAAIRYLQSIQTEPVSADDEEDEAAEPAPGDLRSMSLDRLIEEWKSGDCVRAGSELARRAEIDGDRVIVLVLTAAGDAGMLSRYRLLKASGQWRSSDTGLLVMEMTRRIVAERR